MSLDPDTLVDRRRLKRSVALWRALAIVGLVALLLVAVGRVAPFGIRDYVARLEVGGLIVDDPERDRLLEEVQTDHRAKALIVRIDSPGGSVVGGEALYLAIRRVAEKKPVVAVMGTVATSAAYMTALAADHLVAREGTITGSIGVIMQTAEITELLDEIGVSTEAIKSGPLKGAPSPLEPLTEEARRAARALVTDMYDMFVDLVAERRGFERSRVLELADGRVYTGRQAFDLKLIDSLGGEEEARAWLASAHGIAEELPVHDLRRERFAEELLGEVAASAWKALLSGRLVLDGLISVWHP